MALNPNPESTLVSEDDLYATLLPYRAEPEAFEASVRTRIHALEVQRRADPLADASLLLRAAAAFVPLSFSSGSKIVVGAVPAMKTSVLGKLIGAAAMPAFSLLVLCGAAILGASTIQNVQQGNTSDIDDLQRLRVAETKWWIRNGVFAFLFFVITLWLALLGATSWMLLLYLISLGAMLHVLSGFAKLGLASRRIIGSSCIAGMGLIAQLSAFCMIGSQDIHFVDQMLLPVIFFCGILVLIPIVSRSETGSLGIGSQILRFGFLALMSAFIIGWFTYPHRCSATPARIKHYVESFDRAPFSSSSWQQWEIVASWTIESGSALDLQAPRKLLEAEVPDLKVSLAPFILGTALRTGLVQREYLDKLTDMKSERAILFDGQSTDSLAPVNQRDWLIRAVVLKGNLKEAQRDILEGRLLTTMNEISEDRTVVLEDALRVTQLLTAIGRPINRDRYREKVHAWLREFHCRSASGFELAGGFQADPNVHASSLNETSHAVRLMQIYGIPDGLDVNWIRSYLKPRWLRLDPDQYIAAVTLDRLNGLKDVTSPTLMDYVYYERSMIMAVLLVAMCIYATLSSPDLRPTVGS